ncbi:uncharacterized protein TNCV_1184411 [Trichonephila clavipes]|nr:uncharacterized protein TNCV_1184411 [Trichonephila clavipes]
MYLDDFLRGSIIGHLECGCTQMEVSEELGIAQSVISRLWQRFHDVVPSGGLSSLDYYGCHNPESSVGRSFNIAALDHRPNTIVLYPGSTAGKRRAWFIPDDRHTASSVAVCHTCLPSVVGEARQDEVVFTLMDPSQLYPGKSLALPNLDTEKIAARTRFSLISLPNNEMIAKFSFAIDKSLIDIEARKLIVPLKSQAYTQAAKSSTISTTTQTDENITKIKFAPLIFTSATFISPETKCITSAVSTSSSSTQAHLSPSTSSIAATVSEPQPLIPLSNMPNFPPPIILFTPNESSSSIISASTTNSERMHDAIRSGIEGYKFCKMSCDIAFHICCNLASGSFKLVGCPNDPRYAQLETNWGSGRPRKSSNSAETLTCCVRPNNALLKNGSCEPLHEW